MKFIYILPLLVFSFLFLGCASSGAGGGVNTSDTSDGGDANIAQDASASMGAKTAYEGSTGAGLLMERYKAGQIEGFRD
jgi:hypothetical protein